MKVHEAAMTEAVHAAAKAYHDKLRAQAEDGETWVPWEDLQKADPIAYLAFLEQALVFVYPALTALPGPSPHLIADALGKHQLFAETDEGAIACSCSKFDFQFPTRGDHRAHVTEQILEALGAPA